MAINVADIPLRDLAAALAMARGTKLLMVELNEVEEGEIGKAGVAMGGLREPLELMVAIVLVLGATNHAFRAALEAGDAGLEMTTYAGMVARALEAVSAVETENLTGELH